MKIIQFLNQTHTQMMGYALQAASGEYVMIDGGNTADAPEVARVIRKLGGKPEAWFLTHPHNDHFDAILEIYQKEPALAADVLYQTAFPEGFDMGPAQEEFRRWQDYADTLPQLRYLEIGQEFRFGSMKITVLTVANPEIRENICNNQSAVLAAEENGFRMLFLGDLGIEGGEKFLRCGFPLKADGVQMAHHGQRGVDLGVYEAIGARWAFWPTPGFVWERDPEKSDPNMGPYKILMLRGLLTELGVKHVICTDHTVAFDTETETVTDF